jgi:hypothetical protein
MKFRLWPIASTAHRRARRLLARLLHERPWRPDHANRRADLAQWLRLAVGDDAVQLASVSQQPPADLLDRLSSALADDNASMMPPVAADEMTQAEWDRLPDEARARYQRRQVRRTDPRLLPLSTKLGSRHRRLRR